jgi:ABC-type transport system involved in cytochrome c biogenesis permease subunit
MTILSLAFAAYLFALWKRPLMYAGLALQIAYIISRGMDLGRLPLIGPHDTISFLAASMAAFAVPFAFTLKQKQRGDFIGLISAVAAIFTVFALIAKQQNAPLPPVLKTVWFECHVVLAFMSYALFGVAAILGYFFLKDRVAVMDGLQYRAVLIGYCLFTLSMIFGGIWAYLAWGTYWVWTPKELWTSISWVFYSLYLHARLRNWWMGRPMAYLSITGFAVVLFTYLGVSLLMKSSHSF